jgi:hypothetical protein
MSEVSLRSVRSATYQSAIAVSVLITIATTILALVVAQKWLLPERPTFATYKRQIIERHLDAEVLVLGASHAARGVIPSLLNDRAVNMAGGAQDLYYCCALARRYVPRMPNLRRVILDVDLWGWMASLDRSSDSWRVPLYYYGLDTPPPQWRLNSIKGLASFVVQNRGFEQLDRNPFDDAGFFPGHGRVDPRKGKESAAHHMSLIRETDAEAHLKDVMELIRDLSDRGIEVILVRLPAHRSYRDELSKTALERLSDMTDHIQNKLGVPYLDYFADSRFTDDHFLDGDHLNLGGATVFSKILAHDLGASDRVVTAGCTRHGTWCVEP